MELVLGCGINRYKSLISPEPLDPGTTVTLDINPDAKPDFVWDLNDMPMPMFSDNQFSRIHCYDVLEHFGRQGDFISFFKFFDEIHRILENGGWFIAITPTDGKWAWGDPGHTRIINLGTLDSYLSVSTESRKVKVRQ